MAVDVSLREAVALGDSELVSKLLAESTPQSLRLALNARCDDQWTILMKAAGDGHVDIVRQLLAAGADVNVCVAAISPLMAACILAPVYTAVDVATLLLEAKANPNTVDGYRETCLMKAAERGIPDLIHLLIKNGADVNARDNSEFTALYHAAKAGHAACVKCLLQSGPDEEAQQRALAIAEAKELTEIKEILSPKSTEIEEEKEEVSLPERYTFSKKVLAELPTRNGSVGFPSDISVLLSGVGQTHYTPHLVSAGFGVGQLIFSNDEQLRGAGVRFAPQRRMIMEGMVRLALHGWGPAVLPRVKTITSAVHAACTAVRQVHVMWATTVLGKLRGDPYVEGDEVLAEKAMEVTNLVIRESKEIRRRAAHVVKLSERKMWADPVAPADLIRPGV